MSRVAYAVAAALGAFVALVGLGGLTGDVWSFTVPWAIPLGGLEVSMDRLAGFFLALVGLATVPVSIYAIGYAGDERPGGLAYIGFILSMAAVPLAANVMTFVIAWELTALTSYLLVVQGAAAPSSPATAAGEASDATPHGHREDEPDEAARAAWMYAVMAHAGILSLLAGMLLLSVWTGSSRFADWRQVELDPLPRDGAFALLALGFAAKAGVIPLHVWLPRAHPAAPSHVSALMSGVTIKLGIYGLVRAALDWVGPAPAWWGVAILVAGTVSALGGVLFALVEPDLKRLLAFHSIENVGIILIGLGAGMLFLQNDLGALAVLGVAAALYHTANHTAFKALLFLGAGSVVRGTGTRNIEAMGGLAKRMPWTAAMFVLGAVAISALPPLNGFVSQWLTFQALLQSLQIPHAGIGLVFVAGMAGLALTSGLTMACFVKAFGITFLALPRSKAAATATESSPPMRTGMVMFALACVALGLGPTAVVPLLGSVASELTGFAASLWFGDWLTLDVPGDFASLSTFAVALALVVAAVVPIVALRFHGRLRRRVSDTWGGGGLLQTSLVEYTGAAFSSPFRRILDSAHRTRAIVADRLCRPLARAVRSAADRVRVVPSGSTNVYLVYILAALLLVLVFG